MQPNIQRNLLSTRWLKFVILFSLECIVASSSFSKTQEDDLGTALQQYFTRYTRVGFSPKLTIRLENFDVDNEKRIIDVYGNEGFSSQAFTPTIVQTIYNELQKQLPTDYQKYILRVYAFGREISTLIPNIYREKPDTQRLWGKIEYHGKPWTYNLSSPLFRSHNVITQGLQDRHITLWASHGRYYSYGTHEWVWQRPYLFSTTEDLFTQSIVVPFLIPMLENSGAIVFSPRERDWQIHEVIVDNDTDFFSAYKEQNKRYQWEQSDSIGFAHTKSVYHSGENPFKMGTARVATTVRQLEEASSCVWIPNIPESGNYAVYVAYQTLPNSVDDAVYTVKHGGVTTKIRVNQQMGGSTWTYLGTYFFQQGQTYDNSVSLSNQSEHRGVISADAVRFGGGMGNICRGDSLWGETISGLPRYLEGARYSVQWNGFPDSIYNTKDGFNDYADDINTRSLASNHLAKGSVYVPTSEQGRKVPIELSVAVHSDAGIDTQNGIIGTLTVHTEENGEEGTVFQSGVSRIASSDLSQIVQNSICNDLSRILQRTWTRREVFNRNYSETRIPEVPSTIVEMLSHQNFVDMKYGHDPYFKFLLSRSIYKGILRFISGQHKIPYIVHPLPIRNFSAILQPDGKVLLSWEPTLDSLETSAQPDGYIIYKRCGDGDFDNGTIVRDVTSTLVSINLDEIYSFKISAFNNGGESFPSEILSVMHSSFSLKEVLIVNGFTRLSGPAIINNEEQLGFDLYKDIGVAYIKTPEYSGAQQNFDRQAVHTSGIDALGYSGNELQGTMIQGNTFDYPYIHGKAIKANKYYSFSSCSKGALESGEISLNAYKIVDLILGLQKDDGLSSIKHYKTFEPWFQKLLSAYRQTDGNLLISGSYLASDMQSQSEIDFTRKVLFYTIPSESQVPTDTIVEGNNFHFGIIRSLQASSYAVTHPDCLAAVEGAFPFLTYSNEACAGIAYADNHSTMMILGFPIECLTTDNARNQLFKAFFTMLAQ